jgi:acylphosphatase
MRHANIHTFGTVQGVFYRHTAKEKADILGLTGFVRNEEDGSVYTEVEGEDTAVDEFINWCKKGPMLAKIDKVDVTDGPMQQFSGFTLKS